KAEAYRRRNAGDRGLPAGARPDDAGGNDGLARQGERSRCRRLDFARGPGPSSAANRRKRMAGLRTIFTSAVLALVALAGAAQAGDTAKVAQGALRGQVAGSVASFKGVPFAAPPTGDLRWKPPQAPAK